LLWRLGITKCALYQGLAIRARPAVEGARLPVRMRHTLTQGARHDA
jgi:hypothetical protein